MSGIVDDEQAVRAIVVADEVADMFVQLVLGLVSNVQFYSSRLVVKCVAKECFELDGLRGKREVSVG